MSRIGCLVIFNFGGERESSQLLNQIIRGAVRESF